MPAIRCAVLHRNILRNPLGVFMKCIFRDVPYRRVSYDLNGRKVIGETTAVYQRMMRAVGEASKTSAVINMVHRLGDGKFIHDVVDVTISS